MKYEGESNENLKYVLSCSLLNTKGTQWLHFSMLATLQTVSIIVDTYRQPSCGSNFYRTFKVFIWLSPVHLRVSYNCLTIHYDSFPKTIKLNNISNWHEVYSL